MDVMLSDNMRRLICRFGFLALCLFPTLICLKATFFPVTKSEWSGRLLQQFGLINQVDNVQVVTPQRTDFIDLRFGAKTFDTSLLIDNASLLSDPEGRVLFGRNAIGSIDAFWNAMHRILETVGWSGKSDRPVIVRFQRIELLENAAPGRPTCQWHDLEITLESSGRLLTATFYTEPKSEAGIENPTNDKRVPVTVKRTEDSTGVTWFVDSRGSILPGWVLRGFAGPGEGLNAGATLANIHASLRQQDGLWTGELRGEMSGIDLQKSITNRFGGTLTGLADIQIVSAEIEGSQLKAINGSMNCDQGTIGAQMLNACQHCLGLKLNEPFGNEDIQFSDMNVGFELANFQFAIWPNLSNSIINSREGMAVFNNQPMQSQPVNSLLRLLAWRFDQVAPINRNTAILAQYLVPELTIDPNFSIGPLQRTADQDIGSGGFLKQR